MNTPRWEVLSQTTLIETKYLNVRREKVRLPGGPDIDDFHVISAPDWAGVVCVTEGSELVLVRQYRRGHDGPSLELPAGVLEPSEDPVVGGARELLEETGYEAKHIELLAKLRPEPARHEQWAHFLLARGARPVRAPELDETEHIEVVLRPVAELDAVVAEMVHGPHVAALLLAARRGLL